MQIELKRDEELLTRSQVAESLQCSIDSVNRYMRRGLLEPVAHAPLRFSPKDVQLFREQWGQIRPGAPNADEALTRPGKRPACGQGLNAQIIFGMLKEGKTLQEIVLETAIDPVTVEYFDRWYRWKPGMPRPQTMLEQFRNEKTSAVVQIKQLEAEAKIGRSDNERLRIHTNGAKPVRRARGPGSR